MASAGDVTTRALIPGDAVGVAEVLVKEPMVIAGLGVARRVFHTVDGELLFEERAKDGERCDAGRVVGRVRGALRSILTGERTVLNFLQRLSGVATATSEAVRSLEGTGCRVLDTRKTTPGWRALEKEAVRAGGGFNHRYGLYDGVLIKDNHIEAVGSIAEAIRRARAGAHHLIKVEVEVEDLAGVEEALAAGADVLMLDNMDLPTMREAVTRIGGRAITEASGGLTREKLREVALTGVDYLSMGALTHSARSMDISLNVVPA